MHCSAELQVALPQVVEPQDHRWNRSVEQICCHRPSALASRPLDAFVRRLKAIAPMVTVPDLDIH